MKNFKGRVLGVKKTPWWGKMPVRIAYYRGEMEERSLARLSSMSQKDREAVFDILDIVSDLSIDDASDAIMEAFLYVRSVWSRRRALRVLDGGLSK